jgi:membrane fusion protein (multidrug efflux system)
VSIGNRRPGEVEIVEGLEAGEFVVVDGTLRARPGQPVTITAVDGGDEPLARLLNRDRTGKNQ